MNRRRLLASAAVGAGLVVVAASPAFARGEIFPNPPSAFTRVTVNDDGFCKRSNDAATAVSDAFEDTIILTRGTHTFVGKGDIADVRTGRYRVKITCNDGRVTHFTFRVSSLPGASGAGIGGSVSSANATVLGAGAVLAAGAVGLGAVAVRRRRAG